MTILGAPGAYEGQQYGDKDRDTTTLGAHGA